MLEELTDQLNLRKHVIFTGMVPPSQVQDYYQLGDIFVSASTSETQGLTYVEAAANGLPLLCRKDPCLLDVMVCGENGYDYTDVDGFRQGLDAMLADPQWRIRAGERSRQIAKAFGKDVFGSSVVDIYESVLQGALC